MPAHITKDHATEIARKLDATADNSRSRKHDWMVIEYNGQEVASFGIRRGSRRDAGHDYVAKALHVGPHFARQIAQCTKYREDWIDLMIQQGEIEEAN